ncbi:DUF535 family protein [Ferruginibacter paludis]|uniref:DUF535 family protein n=1 Tax=Ferruginibacter paludis TaxID=1310417 RepID=UPI0025B416AF|nr:DUF535 family protein [Ferruginibacter paludis]MDN3657367.1 DUF535 family protein [Ferruginibacter paludis]
MHYFRKISFISVLIIGWELASSGNSDRIPGYRRKQQWKVVFYILLNPRFAGNWFNYFRSQKFNYISSNRPRLYVKPFRPYISTKWNKKRKVKVILDTYRFIENKVTAFKQFLTYKEGIVIAKLILHNKYEGVVKLSYNDGIRNEGELALSFECDQLGGKITTVVFSIEEVVKGQWVGVIGCVQGHKNKKIQNAFKVTQKLLYGLRPNSLIVYAAQELIRNIGCSAIYGVGNSIHISNRRHAINFPWVQNITFDYDKFWCEVGGKSTNDNWFEIPLIPVRKNVQEIKSHKRSMYAKRYEMLDTLSIEISNSASVVGTSPIAENLFFPWSAATTDHDLL